MAKEFVNPIDKDKITETPSTLEYGHHVGSAVVKAEDQGKLKGRAISAMDHQTDMQLNQIREQMQLLANQVKQLNDRKLISEVIYGAEMRFEPIINHIYHLYVKEDKSYILSLIAPDQWGRSKKSFDFVATIQLLADHTWDILEKNEDFDFGE
ncbi:MAG: 3-dehydroquinate synthetase [Crocinitomicaceae bacterium]|jgi:3-dehydroquinate synthetase